MQRLEAEQAAADTASRARHGRTKKLKRPNGTPPDDAQMNFTDPESRVTKTGRGHFEQCYNAQVAVDAAQQIIVAAAVTTNAADVGQLVPLTEQAEANVGDRAARMLADAGYKSEANFAALEARGLDGYVSLGKGEAQRAETEAQGGPCTQRMGAKLRTEEGRQRFKRRKAIVQPPLDGSSTSSASGASEARAPQDRRRVEPRMPRDESATDADRADHRMTGTRLPTPVRGGPGVIRASRTLSDHRRLPLERAAPATHPWRRLLDAGDYRSFAVHGREEAAFADSLVGAMLDPVFVHRRASAATAASPLTANERAPGDRERRAIAGAHRHSLLLGGSGASRGQRRDDERGDENRCG